MIVEGTMRGGGGGGGGRLCCIDVRCMNIISSHHHRSPSYILWIPPGYVRSQVCAVKGQTFLPGGAFFFRPAVRFSLALPRGYQVSLSVSRTNFFDFDRSVSVTSSLARPTRRAVLGFLFIPP